jgi:hypothetical protein
MCRYYRAPGLKKSRIFRKHLSILPGNCCIHENKLIYLFNELSQLHGCFCDVKHSDNSSSVYLKVRHKTYKDRQYNGYCSYSFKL